MADKWLIRRHQAYGGRVVVGRVGPKVTEIGMIFDLRPVRIEPGLGFVEFQGAVLVFATPTDEANSGDIELPSDFGEADCPGTQVEELLNGLLISHYCLSGGRHL